MKRIETDDWAVLKKSLIAFWEDDADYDLTIKDDTFIIERI